MLPLDLGADIIIALIDLALDDDSGFGYCGALHLIHHLSEADINLKLEIAKKIITVTFSKLNSPFHIAKQCGWQESIARLLVRKHITSNYTVEGNYVLGKDIQDQPFDDGGVEFAMDMLTFDEKTMEIGSHSSRDHTLILNEIQANFTEAANVIEHEIKGKFTPLNLSDWIPAYLVFVFADLAETVSGKVAGNISSMYSILRQKTCDIQETFESLAHATNIIDKQKSMTTLSTVSSNSTSEENLSAKTTSIETKSINRNDSTESDSLANDASTKEAKDEAHKISLEGAVNKEDELVYLVTNILFTILWRGIDSNGGDSWKERGQVIACVNLLGLNNELYCSHLTLRLRIFEMGVQAALIDLSETSTQTHIHQENAAQLLRMIYDLVVLDPNEDDAKKCSPKLLDGVLALMGTFISNVFSLQKW